MGMEYNSLILYKESKDITKKTVSEMENMPKEFVQYDRECTKIIL